MSSLAACPHCRQAITLSVEGMPDQRFLCPHCQGEFAAQDAVSAGGPLPTAPNAGEPTPVRRLQVEFVSDAAERFKALPTANLQRRSRRTSWLNQLIGIVGGGVVGLTLGYCILLRLRGQEADFLQIADRLPAWVTGLPQQADEGETLGEPAQPNLEGPVDESNPGKVEAIEE